MCADTQSQRCVDKQSHTVMQSHSHTVTQTCCTQTHSKADVQTCNYTITQAHLSFCIVSSLDRAPRVCVYIDTWRARYWGQNLFSAGTRTHLHPRGGTGSRQTPYTYSRLVCKAHGCFYLKQS